MSEVRMANEKRPRPQNGIPKPTLKEKFAALGNLPRFFKLVWQTNHWYTVLDGVLRLIRSTIPVSILYIGKLIIDQVVLLAKGNHTDHRYLWELVAAEFSLAIISDALSRITTLVDSLLGDLFSNYTSIKIMEHAATLDLDQFEDSAFYDKLERARQQTVGRTILLSQILTQVQDIVTRHKLRCPRDHPLLRGGGDGRGGGSGSGGGQAGICRLVMRMRTWP